MVLEREIAIERLKGDMVSVIIPTYNRAGLLLQAIASVRLQSWPYIQIIVADDGSTDNTRDLVSGMSDVLYVRQEHGGQGAARNLGLRHAQGVYICTLDSDDVWMPDFVESSLNALRILDADFVFSNWEEETPDGGRHTSNFEQEYGWSSYRETELKGWRLLEPEQSRAIYIESCISPSSALLFPKELIADGWSDDMKIADDWSLLLRLVLSRPCRVAVSTRRAWTKSVSCDNISCKSGVKAFNRYAYVHDFEKLVNGFSTKMTKQERARFYVRIAFYQFVLSGLEFKQKRYGLIPGLLFKSAGSLLRALFVWPAIVAKYARKFVGRNRTITGGSVGESAKVLAHETVEVQPVS